MSCAPVHHLRPPRRLWEVDAARGIAVILMIVFHTMWDLFYFGISTINVFVPSWQAFARSIGMLFLGLSGVSLTLVAARLSSASALAHYALIRGGRVFALGLVVNGVTYLLMGESYVRFGILHLLGTMLLVAVPFVFTPLWLTYGVGVAMLVGGFAFQQVTGNVPWLVWIGIPVPRTPMIDYYPILPWGGATILGVGFGRMLYPSGIPRVPIECIKLPAWIQGVAFLGRHSFLIYGIHQPVLFGAILLLQSLMRGYI